MPTLRKKILVVEEEPVLLDILAFRLELLGFEVETKATADAALTWLAASVPDLIAVGHISDMDPMDLLNRVSDDPRTSETPALVLSPDPDLDAVQRAFNAGANEYLLTPFDPLVFEQKVQNLLTGAAVK
jgi:DNA-binding response OmpR family regulator